MEAPGGGPVDAARLTPCGPVYFADNPFAPLPPTMGRVTRGG